MRPRLLRITTVPISLNLLLAGQFSFFQQNGFEVLAISSDGPEVQKLRSQGVNHQVVNMTRSITPMRDFIALCKLVWIIFSFKPTIVHTHTPKAGLLGMLAAWFCRVPVRMHTVAGLPVMEARGFKRWLLLTMERLTYACANCVFPNSQGLHEFMKSTFGRQQSKFRIIGKGSSNGIDSEYFLRTHQLEEQAKLIRDRYTISDDEIVFSFVGRLVRDKGIIELAHAFKNLKFPCRLLLVGDFEESIDPLPESTMDMLISDSRITLSGFQDDIRPWMMASDVFVFPSYREGFPNVLMQAACLEVPVIASNINGCNEIIQHTETGILVPSKNVDSLYLAMVQLATETLTRQEFGKRSRVFVSHNFEQKYVWGKLLIEYKRALDKMLL